MRNEPLSDEITITWHVDDVLEVRPDLTCEQARRVLARVDQDHDASCGICWDTLEYVADALYPEPEDG